MSRYRRDTADEIAEGAVGCLFLGVFFALAAAIGLIIESSKVPPQEELRKLKHPSFWGQSPELQICLNCGTDYEAGETVCASCGPIQLEGANDKNDLLERQLFAIAILLIFVLMVALIMFSMD